MRRAAAVCILTCFLTGCFGVEKDLERGLSLRQSLLSAQQCSFSVDITADYGDQIYEFSMDCGVDSGDELRFAVVKPDTLSGITGVFSGTGGKITFDDTAVHINLIADGQLSPVSAPWIFWNTLRSGYIRYAGMDGGHLRLTVDDSYQEDALQLDFWLDENNLPVHCEILHEGRRILSLNIRNIQIL